MSFMFFFFKQKTAYEMRISDWSSDVCSSDLRDRAAVDVELGRVGAHLAQPGERDRCEGLVDLVEIDVVDGEAGAGQRPTRRPDRLLEHDDRIAAGEIGRASCRERVCQSV